jgi:hypothetical protein
MSRLTTLPAKPADDDDFVTAPCLPLTDIQRLDESVPRVKAQVFAVARERGIIE